MSDGHEAWGMGQGEDSDPGGVAEPNGGGGIETYEDLRVWQAGMDLVESVYRLTRSFPDDERFGLTSQLRRAAVSVPSNIAEGFGRGSRKDYVRFLRIARGSLYEVRTQLLIAQRIGFASDEEAIGPISSCEGLRRQLQALISAVDRS